MVSGAEGESEVSKMRLPYRFHGDVPHVHEKDDWCERARCVPWPEREKPMPNNDTPLCLHCVRRHESLECASTPPDDPVFDLQPISTVKGRFVPDVPESAPPDAARRLDELERN